jgi:hypothetical protein
VKNNYNRWSEVPSHLKTRTTLGTLGLRPKPDAIPVATFHGYGHYPVYDMADCQPVKRRPKAAPPERTPEVVALAIQSLSRHAHRARKPGQCKVRLAAKTLALKKLLSEGKAKFEGRQRVNGRECAVVAFGGLSFHLPVEQIDSDGPHAAGLADLPEEDAVTVEKWPKPAMTLTAVREALRHLGVETKAISVRCPHCLEAWRCDVAGTRQSRTCPRCYKSPRWSYDDWEDEDDWEDGHDWWGLPASPAT